MTKALKKVLITVLSALFVLVTALTLAPTFTTSRVANADSAQTVEFPDTTTGTKTALIKGMDVSNKYILFEEASTDGISFDVADFAFSFQAEELKVNFAALVSVNLDGLYKYDAEKDELVFFVDTEYLIKTVEEAVPYEEGLEECIPDEWSFRIDFFEFKAYELTFTDTSNYKEVRQVQVGDYLLGKTIRVYKTHEYFASDDPEMGIDEAIPCVNMVTPNSVPAYFGGAAYDLTIDENYQETCPLIVLESQEYFDYVLDLDRITIFANLNDYCQDLDFDPTQLYFTEITELMSEDTEEYGPYRGVWILEEPEEPSEDFVNGGSEKKNFEYKPNLILIILSLGFMAFVFCFVFNSKRKKKNFRKKR